MARADVDIRVTQGFDLADLGVFLISDNKTSRGEPAVSSSINVVTLDI